MNGNLRIETRILMSETRKRWMIALAVNEILFGAAAIGTCLATLIFSVEGRHSLFYSYYPGSYVYGYDSGIYIFSITSQGIWAGCFAIIAASTNIEMARLPTTTTKSYSVGFSSWSTALSLGMVTLEAIAVSWRFSGVPYSYTLWDLHVALLSISVILSILIISSLIVASTVYSGGSGGCCGNSTSAISPGTLNSGNAFFLPGNGPIQPVLIPPTIANPGDARLEQRATASPPLIGTAAYYAVPAPTVQQQQAIPLVLQQPHSYLFAPATNA